MAMTMMRTTINVETRQPAIRSADIAGIVIISLLSGFSHSFKGLKERNEAWPFLTIYLAVDIDKHNNVHSKTPAGVELLRS
jgi:hypothetical protein